MGRCVLVRALVTASGLLCSADRNWVHGFMLKIGRNHYADHLANLAHEGTNGLVCLPNPPDSLLPSLHADALRHGKLRF
ncbi:hypothetical protein Goklo_002560 [Gossypium klotzschianum]|uniref:Secreted protein n=1 Tax=Gossypium klotzschianum TaxID=34286 RepID=A0A7J8VUL9_9ROSI|nr:hypothetical protein [Gossypium klotzschianum]